MYCSLFSDIYIEHRLLMEQRIRGGPANATPSNPRNKFPPELMRRFEIYLKPLSSSKSIAIRQIKAAHVGSLVTVRGVVTRWVKSKQIMDPST